MPGLTAMCRRSAAAARLASPRGRRIQRMLLVTAMLVAVPATESLAAQTAAARAAGRSETMLGTRAIGRAVDQQPAGRAEAFAFTARSSGTATTVGVYVGSRARAARLRVALYSNFHSRPGARLATGSRRGPRSHAWALMSLHATRMVAGRDYWLVILPSGGLVSLRHGRTRACTRADSRRVRLSAFPGRWGTRAASAGCRLSAYVSGYAPRVGSPPPRSPAPSPSPPSPPSPSPSPSPPSPPSTRGCFAQPSACGYPDQTNTGAPAGSAGTVKNGDQQINLPGTYSGWNVQNGSVRINASNVTIKDFMVTNSGSSSNAILIPAGVTNVTIEDSTLTGASAGSAIQYAVQNVTDGPVTGLRLRLLNCTECWSGGGTLQDSYALTVAGSHVEDVYFGGGGGTLTLTHNTLYNPEDQTAAIFTKTDFGDLGTVTVADNLLAGGGYTIYGGLGGSGNVNGPVTVTGNRFARSRSGSPDSSGYFPNGGSYAAVADFRSSVTKWSGNYWDDNLSAVPEQ